MFVGAMIFMGFWAKSELSPIGYYAYEKYRKMRQKSNNEEILQLQHRLFNFYSIHVNAKTTKLIF